ncbi:MAG: hypothetical protein ACTTHY_08460 [Prevotella intermedia]
MSNKNKLRKKARKACEEKEVKSVSKWIFKSLMTLALILIAWVLRSSGVRDAYITILALILMLWAIPNSHI